MKRKEMGTGKKEVSCLFKNKKQRPITRMLRPAVLDLNVWFIESYSWGAMLSEMQDKLK